MNIILLGPPGSGKGTQSSYLVNKHDFLLVSTGDLIRKEVDSKTQIGIKIKEFVSSGYLVPDAFIYQIIKDKIVNVSKNIIFDGFPRNLDQAICLDEVMSNMGLKIDAVVNFIIDDNSLIKRICGRYLCKHCGAIYNKSYNPVRIDGVCDVCKSRELIFRDDDSEEVLKNRLISYRSQLHKIINFYEKKSLIISIDALKDRALISRELSKLIFDYLNYKV